LLCLGAQVVDVQTVLSLYLIECAGLIGLELLEVGLLREDLGLQLGLRELHLSCEVGVGRACLAAEVR
jgi:hypothetical protein